MEHPLIDQVNQQNRKISSGVTGIIAIIFLLISFFWMIVKLPLPPIEEEQYTLVEGGGGMDYGNYTEGSGDVNNFSDPGDNPNPSKSSQASSSDEEKSESADEQELSDSESEADVSAKPKTEKKPVKEVKKPKTEKKKTEVQTDKQDDKNTEGGANHGKGKKKGNKGRPDSPVLDSRGLFSFGDGADGLKGRIALELRKPIYVVEAETKITYSFDIRPDGTVKKVKALTLASNADLKNAGMAAIYDWKFNAIDTDQVQTIKVTITFKLK